MPDSINPISNQHLLAQLRQLRETAGGSAPASAGATAAGGESFSAMLGRYVNQVNDVQQAGSELATRFDSGDRDVQMVDVMVAMQRSRIAFEALTQVRNRVLSAYQEIMNMQV